MVATYYDHYFPRQQYQTTILTSTSYPNGGNRRQSPRAQLLQLLQTMATDNNPHGPGFYRWRKQTTITASLGGGIRQRSPRVHLAPTATSGNDLHGHNFSKQGQQTGILRSLASPNGGNILRSQYPLAVASDNDTHKYVFLQQ